MQFYVIDRDPEVNAKMLPDYALKKVNVREGWQMLSDIGHAVGVHWEGQNKAYNMTHPNTLRWYQNNKVFADFTMYYWHCLVEYVLRFGKPTVYHRKYPVFVSRALDRVVDALPGDDQYQSVIRYMLNWKMEHLTEAEVELLRSKLEGK